VEVTAWDAECNVQRRSIPLTLWDCLEVGSCGLPDHRELQYLEICNHQVIEACESISTGPGFVVSDLGDATLRAGSQVTLGEDSQVASDAALTVETGPSVMPEYDFGDAPVPYPTLKAHGGARHRIVPGVYLGAGVDSETDGQPDAVAAGDDLTGDDEDGVVFTSMVHVGLDASVEVTASTDGFLHA
jgi:hypothetical protein